MYWLLFIPLTFLVNLALKKWPIERIISVNSAKHLTLALLSSLVHTLIFSILMAVMSELLLGYSFSFTGVLRKSLAEDFFTGLLMYSLLLLLLNRSLRHGAPDLPTLGLGTLKVETIKPDHLTVFLIKAEVSEFRQKRSTGSAPRILIRCFTGEIRNGCTPKACPDWKRG